MSSIPHPSKPPVELLAARCPDIDERLVRQHLDRLDNTYFESFDEEEIALHINGLAELTPANPVKILLSKSETHHLIDLTILAFDYHAVFSLITGILSGTGASIISGDVFTYERTEPPVSRPGSKLRRFVKPAKVHTSNRRKIIDRFSCELSTTRHATEWAREVDFRLQEVLGLLEKGDPESIQQAKHRVNNLVTLRLESMKTSDSPVLYPVEVQIENTARATRLVMRSQDTPAFLYAMTSALSLHALSIERVRIRTRVDRIEDSIDLVTKAGKPVTDPDLLGKIKLSVLITKQFTYFLDKAPDPYSALSRFDQLLEEATKHPDSEEWIRFLSDPGAMRNLARLLGASDYLWEDFIRLQYEALLPILSPHIQGQPIEVDLDTLPERFNEALTASDTYEKKRQAFNEFKDREIFLIDLSHILDTQQDFLLFSENLSRLADEVVGRAMSIVYDHLCERHGTPRTVGGLPARHAVLGLGKLGGGALGYASDVELLFVYSDNGKTDGSEPIENAEFFAKMAIEITKFIEAKREGIFRVDLRLRPYGNSGPQACSLESFVQYYGPSGEAHSYERLALVRLRAIGGDAALGARVERLRDEFIYFTKSIDSEELRELRIRQATEKNKPGMYNSKFSTGALVDLEYAVQILQVSHGKDLPNLRTPRIHEALTALRLAGVLSSIECERLVAAYHFLRRLINGLRLLRGSARDLFLPAMHSDEFIHLARRMGYQRQGDLGPAQQLFMEFETRTAAVRTFVEHHFGRESIPGPITGNIADLILAEEVEPEVKKKVLQDAGFQQTDRAYKNLRRLAGEGRRQDLFAQLAVLACDMLRQEPDPDMALNNWERFIAELPDPEAHFERILSQPRHFEILLGIFSRSQYLADALIRNPEFLDWMTSPENLNQTRSAQQLEEELERIDSSAESHMDWLNQLRKFRRKETLRIGTRDMCIRAPIREIVSDLSTLAECITDCALRRAWTEVRKKHQVTPHPFWDPTVHFCIMAFGKLGGRELNYSSDIDLIGVYDESFEEVCNHAGFNSGPELISSLMEKLHANLSKHTVEGYAFRVDFRLRPYGSAGEAGHSVSRLEAYYQKEASPWEIQAVLKLRPVAGAREVGQTLLNRLRPILLSKRDASAVSDSIVQMRERSIKSKRLDADEFLDIKSGIGGIRDIEFLVQGLQLIHAHTNEDVLDGNTLNALDKLKSAGILPEETVETLKEDYIFHRRVEHYLQILHDRQIHTLPEDPDELTALAKRMSGPTTTADAFMADLDNRVARVRETYQHFLSPGEPESGRAGP